jgi:hypothetical protein
MARRASKPTASVADVARGLFDRRPPPVIPQKDLERLGAPGRPCYVCTCDAWYRLGEQYPWVCSICHPIGAV